MKDVIQSIGTLSAILFGIWGFFRWRSELVARRRIELCEDVLRCLYETRDVINDIRHPAIWSGEGTTCPRNERDSEQERHHARLAYVYRERLESRRPALAELNKLRYRFMAVFGAVWWDTFQVILGSVNRVIMAADILRDEADTASRNPGHDANRSPELRAKLRELESIVWKGFGEDALENEINIAAQRLEDKCRRELQKAASIWYGLRGVDTNGKDS